MKSKLEILQDVVNNQQYIKINCTLKNGKNKKVILDLQTASLLLQIIGKMNQENKGKFLNWNWVSMVNFAYSKAK